MSDILQKIVATKREELVDALRTKPLVQMREGVMRLLAWREQQDSSTTKL
jgi:hypothetical protein